MKKLTILHYHQRPGGIATVIRNAQRALAERFEINVLANFGYNDRPAQNRAAFLAESRTLMQQLKRATRGTGILHTHNLTLGKHPRLTCAVKMLAEGMGMPVINQIHDFVEDERSVQLRALRHCTGRRDDRFWREICYYDFPNVLWTTLTTRAAEKLTERGVPPARIRVLPNPVDAEFFTQPGPTSRHPSPYPLPQGERECGRPTPSSDRPFLSPPGERTKVRGIGDTIGKPATNLFQPLNDALHRIAAFARRHGYDFDPRRKILLSPIKLMVRKNNAEAVELLKRLNKLRRRDEYQLLISLEASSEDDRKYGEALKRKVRREGLPVVIGIGEEVDLLTQFHLAHAIVTTSKMEGFGYAFMEGWLCGKLVVGRDIPEVTRDFVSEGMDLRHLYREFNNEAVKRIIRLLERPPQKLIAHNRSVVLRNYSLLAYARRYDRLLLEFPSR